MSGSLSSADYDRLFEYRLAPSKDDLRKSRRSRKAYKSKGRAAYTDPTANRAIRNIMYSTKSEGY